MTPEEWPIAATVANGNAPARAASRGRLSTARVDFFLNPSERLTEQERALMTSMLHCLVGDTAGEIRAELPPGWCGANDDDAQIVEVLTRAGLLDQAELMQLLLRRADEERIGAAARARGGNREARVIQALVSHQDSAVSASAMALILARGRRRDRFGQCLISFDDLSPDAAARLVYATAAAFRNDIAGVRGPAAADSELAAAAAVLLDRHDPARGIDSLTASLVALLDDAGGLSDELLLACAQEGEVGFLAEVLARRAGISGAVALDVLLLADPALLMGLLRIANFSREASAGLLASLSDLLGIDDPGAAITLFDSMTAEEVKAVASWLSAAPTYRAALEVLGRNG